MIYLDSIYMYIYIFPYPGNPIHMDHPKGHVLGLILDIHHFIATRVLPFPNNFLQPQ